MLVFLLSLVLMLVVISIMSIGVMMGRKPIAGSCGGLKNLGDGAACEICGGDPARCDNGDTDTPVETVFSETVFVESSDELAHDATKPAIKP